jgi:hypothetical protein
MLPADLRAAEQQALAAIQSALAAEPRGRWTLELRFEGLRLLPVVTRLSQALLDHAELRLLFPDAGAAALARRDAADLAPRIASFSDHLRRQADGPGDDLLLLVGASQAEYEQVETLCAGHGGPILLINPSLEDAAVGIGSVARQRRRGFLSIWQAAYALVPQAGRALRRAHPDSWELYRLDPDGYRLAARFDSRPDAEQLEEALAAEGGGGVAAGLRAVDRMIEGLQR